MQTAVNFSSLFLATSRVRLGLRCCVWKQSVYGNLKRYTLLYSFAQPLEWHWIQAFASVEGFWLPFRRELRVILASLCPFCLCVFFFSLLNTSFYGFIANEYRNRPVLKSSVCHWDEIWGSSNASFCPLCFCSLLNFFISTASLLSYPLSDVCQIQGRFNWISVCCTLVIQLYSSDEH